MFPRKHLEAQRRLAARGNSRASTGISEAPEIPNPRATEPPETGERPERPERPENLPEQQPLNADGVIGVHEFELVAFAFDAHL